jgi:hypothetical protein
VQFVPSETCASNTIQKNISHAVYWRLCRNWQLLRGYAARCDITTLQVHILAGQQLSSTYKTPTTCERLVGYYHIFLGAVYIFSCSVFILLSLPRRCQPPSPQPRVVHPHAHSPLITDSHRAKSFWSCTSARSLQHNASSVSIDTKSRAPYGRCVSSVACCM